MRRSFNMAKKFNLIAAMSFAAAVITAVWYKIVLLEVLLTFAIIFGTIAYHLIMRLLTGLVFNNVMNNKADVQKRWYQVGRFEMMIYEKLRVKKWSRKMPTYDTSLFDTKIHTWDEIAQAMCQAELVHETIVVLSFLPIIAGMWFGAFPVFIVTSILSAMLDTMFVLMQRYNRQRIIKMMKSQNVHYL